MEEPGEPSESSSGLLDSVRRLIDTALGLAQNRLELLSIEIQQQTRHLVVLLVWTLLAVALGLVALVVVTVTIVVLFWDSARIPVLLVLCAFYVGATTWAVTRARKLLRDARKPLGDSIQELKKDRACL